MLPERHLSQRRLSPVYLHEINLFANYKVDDRDVFHSSSARIDIYFSVYQSVILYILQVVLVTVIRKADQCIIPVYLMM